MTLWTVQGDLFKTEYKYIAHGCNAQGVMGSGIAKEIKDRYPEAYQIYRSSWESWNASNSDMLLGGWTRAESKDKVIYNLITQRHYGKQRRRYVSYDAIYDAFFSLRESIPLGEVLAIPMIGAGLGGGHWEVIKGIIERAAGNIYNICVYER